MKKIILSAVTFFLSLNCYADTSFRTDEKIYVSPESICFTSNQIYINIANELFAVEGIASDDQGLFILDQSAEYFEDCVVWDCKKCRTKNSVKLAKCKNCGKGWNE